MAASPSPLNCRAVHPSDESLQHKRNYFKRALGVLLCCAVPIAFAASLVSGKTNSDWLAGAWWLAPAVVLAAFNFYLAFIRSRLYRYRNGSLSGYKWASSIPILGTFALIPGVFAGWGAPGTAILGLLLYFLDLGGLPWFLIASWKDRLLWDQPRDKSRHLPLRRTDRSEAAVLSH